jgi:(p)ppGpp synthase/HD superfamily hydrolase
LRWRAPARRRFHNSFTRGVAVQHDTDFSVAQDARSSARLSFTRDLPLTQAAIAFAEEHHDGQRREADGASFLVHPLEVASLLERSHYPDYVVAAAVLHDVLEDTDAEPAELEARFGREVAELVELVSDDPSITDVERRKDDVRERVRRAAGYAPVVYGADKVSKVRELRMLLATGLDPKQAEVKLRRYRESLAMMEQKIPSSRVTGLLRFELEALENLPPRPPQSEPPGAPRSPS